MNNNKIKWIARILSGVLLFSSIAIPTQNVFASENIKIKELDLDPELSFTDEEMQGMVAFVEYFEGNEEEFLELFLNAVNESKSEFIDPSVAEELLDIQSLGIGQGYITLQPGIDNKYTTQGKATMTAKAAVKAIRAVMNRIGQKSWDKMIKKIENSTGTTLVVLHWKGINNFLDYAAGFKGTVEDALTQFLVNKAKFNKTFARYVARAFIFVVL